MFKKTLLFLFLVFIFAAPVLLIVMAFPMKHSDFIKKYSAEFGLDPDLVYAVINAESGFNKNAVSPKGAKGLMQIMDKTGQWAYQEMKKEEVFDPSILFIPDRNIEIGCWYLSRLINQFNDIEIALAAYNAGSGNVSEWLLDDDYSDGAKLTDIPFGETKEYVKKVNRYKQIYAVLRRIPWWT